MGTTVASVEKVAISLIGTPGDEPTGLLLKIFKKLAQNVDFHSTLRGKNYRVVYFTTNVVSRRVNLCEL